MNKIHRIFGRSMAHRYCSKSQIELVRRRLFVSRQTARLGISKTRGISRRGRGPLGQRALPWVISKPQFADRNCQAETDGQQWPRKPTNL
jgi:hypothetical protein